MGKGKLVKHKNLISRLLACLVVISSAGCGVGVPTRADVKVVRSQPVGFEEGAVISIGPRLLLEELSSEITNAYPDIEIIEGLLFRDTAFPEGGWKLETLFQPGVSKEVSETLNVDYLVLTGAMKSEDGEEEGFLFPLLAGAMSIEHEATISAVIIDLKAGKPVSRLECTARGTSRMVYYVIFVVGIGPTMKPETIEGLASEIGKAITELAPPGERRIAVLALEFPASIGKTSKDTGCFSR